MITKNRVWSKGPEVRGTSERMNREAGGLAESWYPKTKCRDDRIRTCDHSTPSRALYRTELHPDAVIKVTILHQVKSSDLQIIITLFLKTKIERGLSDPSLLLLKPESDYWQHSNSIVCVVSISIPPSIFSNVQMMLESTR